MAAAHHSPLMMSRFPAPSQLARSTGAHLMGSPAGRDPQVAQPLSLSPPLLLLPSLSSLSRLSLLRALSPPLSLPPPLPPSPPPPSLGAVVPRPLCRRRRRRRR